jgi:hypothetical protein
MSGFGGWAVVATYAQVYEADIAKARLESVGIPAQVLGEHIGVFGPGWSGMAIRGLRLVVPEEVLEEARAALEDGEEYADWYEPSDDWGPGAGGRG